MKVAVECKSPLLQKSLEIFLSPYLSPLKQCDIVIRDFKKRDDVKTFYISASSDADLVKPFSKADLVLALESRYSNKKNEDKFDTKLDFSILEKRIDALTKEYQKNILDAVRAFYG